MTVLVHYSYAPTAQHLDLILVLPLLAQILPCSGGPSTPRATVWYTVKGISVGTATITVTNVDNSPGLTVGSFYRHLRIFGYNRPMCYRYRNAGYNLCNCSRHALLHHGEWQRFKH